MNKKVQIRKNLGILREKKPQNFEVKTGVVLIFLFLALVYPQLDPLKCDYEFKVAL